MEFALTDYDKQCADNVKKGFAELKQHTYTKEGRGRLNDLFKYG